MKQLTLIVVTTMLAGCQRDVEQVLIVPATAGAVDCATRAAGLQGYTPAQNQQAADAPRLARPLFGRSGDPPHEGNARDWHIQDYLTITAAGDSLRFVAVGSTIEGKALAPSPRTLAHVQEIVTQCAPSR